MQIFRIISDMLYCSIMISSFQLEVAGPYCTAQILVW